jgi:endonuclease/exonuclease/phosphatase family metal-dependent hydrolase
MKSGFSGGMTRVVRRSLMTVLLASLASPVNASADELPEKISIATWNLEWFYDDLTSDNSSDLSRAKSAPTREDWDWKRNRVADVISELKPTIMCLQEVENRDVLYKLLKDVENKCAIKYRYAFIDGFDFGTDQDVAIIFQDGLVEYSRREQSREMFESGNYYNLSKHLFARFEWGSGGDRQTLVLLNVHLRAGAGNSGLRQRQARLIRAWLAPLIERGENVMVTGDFNTEEDFGAETPGGEMSIIRGLNNEFAGDELLDANAALDVSQRSTHISGRQYDRILYSRSLNDDDGSRRDFVFAGAAVYRDLVIQGAVDTDSNHWDDYYGQPADQRDLSDHYPLQVEFNVR